MFLVAFTDLPIGPTHHRARLWDMQTIMSAPDLPPAALPRTWRVPAGYRFGAYVYEYESDGADGAGEIVARDEERPAAAHVQRAGLAGLEGLATEGTGDARQVRPLRHY